MILPDGVSIRNFGTHFLREIPSEMDVEAFHSVPSEDTSTLIRDSRISWIPMPRYRESSWANFLRQLTSYGQMFFAGTRSMKHNLRMNKGSTFGSKLLYRSARIAGRLAARPNRLAVVDAWRFRSLKKSKAFEAYVAFLKASQPSVVLSAHQRPPSILPAILAARELGVPTATFIFSWDNLTSKGTIAAPFDHYFVWSELMKKELLLYYPHVEAGSVHVVGTPQFDPYSDSSLIKSRGEFFNQIGADPHRPLICYSGGDPATCPEDPDHVRVLLELIRCGDVASSPQVAVRPAPVDDGVRYRQVLQDFPELLFLPPLWERGVGTDWSQVVPREEDIVTLSNLTFHSTLNVNVASTMTLDFAIRDKPVVNIAFDVGNPPPFGVPLWNYYYEFEHYRPVVEIGAARFARSPEELAEHINLYLDNPGLDRAQRKALIELEVGVPIGSSTAAILSALQLIAS